MNSENVITIDSSIFSIEVVDSNIPVVVDFLADWCGPCKMMSPIMDELASKYRKTVKFVKINIDDNSDLIAKYEIKSIPTLLLFKKGMIVYRTVGIVSRKDLTSMIDNLI